MNFSKMLKKSFLLTACLILFFSFFLGSRQLNTPDEGRYAEVAREMLVTNDYVTPRVNGIVFLDKPPLFYWAEAASMKVFGIHEWAVRMVPALFALFGCLVAYRLTRELYGRRAAWLAVGILSTSPLYFLLSRYVNLDLSVAVLISSALLFFLWSQNVSDSRRKTRYLIFSYLSAAAAILTKGLIGFVFPAMIIGAWILLLNRWAVLRQMRLPLGILIILVVCLPWFYAVQKANPEFLHYFFIFQQFQRFTGQGYNGLAAWWFYLPVICIGFLPFIGFLAAALKFIRHWKRRQQYANEYFLCLWILLVTIFFSIPHSKLISYIAPIFPALAILVAGMLSRLSVNDRFILVGKYLSSISLLLFAFALAIAAEYIPNSLSEDIVMVRHGLWAMALCLVLCVIIVNYVWRKNFYQGLVGLILGLVITFSGLSALAPQIRVNSIKSFWDCTQQALGRASMAPPFQIVVYEDFFQDLPFYAEQKIITVTDWNNPSLAQKDNALGQLAWGMQYAPNSRAWMWTPDEFLQHWHHENNIVVILRKNKLEAFAKQVDHRYRLLLQDQTWVALVR